MSGFHHSMARRGWLSEQPSSQLSPPESFGHSPQCLDGDVILMCPVYYVDMKSWVTKKNPASAGVLIVVHIYANENIDNYPKICIDNMHFMYIYIYVEYIVPVHYNYNIYVC